MPDPGPLPPTRAEQVGPFGTVVEVLATAAVVLFAPEVVAAVVGSPWAVVTAIADSSAGGSMLAGSAGAAVGSAALRYEANIATKTGDEAFHYTSSKWIESITTNGLNKGAYATPNGSLSPLQASLELALPPNRALPDAVLRIDLAGLRRAGYDIPTPTRVSSTVSSGGRTYSMPGGGYEMQFPYAIPPEFIKVVRR